MPYSVYFLSLENRIKVGISEDVTQRVKTLECASGSAIQLLGSIPGGRDLEQAIHKRLQNRRLRGEWFVDCAEVREVVAALLAEGGAAIGFAAITPAPKDRRGIPVGRHCEAPDEFAPWHAFMARFSRLHALIKLTREYRALDVVRPALDQFAAIMKGAVEAELEAEPRVIHRADAIVSGAEQGVRELMATP